MKKLFAVLALVGVMTSCKDKKKEEKKPEETISTPATTTPAETTPATTTSSDVPKFADAEVQAYVNDYTVFVTSYVDAYKAKDMTQIAAMSQKMQDWSSRSMSVAQKLSNNPAEATAFTNYMTKLSEQLTAAMQMK